MKQRMFWCHLSLGYAKGRKDHERHFCSIFYFFSPLCNVEDLTTYTHHRSGVRGWWGAKKAMKINWKMMREFSFWLVVASSSYSLLLQRFYHSIYEFVITNKASYKVTGWYYSAEKRKMRRRKKDDKRMRRMRSGDEQNWHSIDVIKLVIYVEWRRFGRECEVFFILVDFYVPHRTDMTRWCSVCCELFRILSTFWPKNYATTTKNLLSFDLYRDEMARMLLLFFRELCLLSFHSFRWSLVFGVVGEKQQKKLSFSWDKKIEKLF